jgi:hypothetical protein
MKRLLHGYAAVPQGANRGGLRLPTMAGCRISAMLIRVSCAFLLLAGKVRTRQSLLARFLFSAGPQSGCRRLGLTRAPTGRSCEVGPRRENQG